MEENIIIKSEAAYFQSAVKMFTGDLVLTNNRIVFTGEHARLKMNHGLLGNVIRDQVEKKLGYDKAEEYMINIPIAEVSYEFKRFGFTKRLILRDKKGQLFKIQIAKKADRNAWPSAINDAVKLHY